ncbi:MAG TPA: PA14 domain-containing protein, partial [Polyangiaceae bacterium]|nr:PA14 domain-containing protein [Polyangiaceae bacterium]
TTSGSGGAAGGTGDASAGGAGTAVIDHNGGACAMPFQGTGSGVSGEYFSDNTLTTPALIRLDDAIDFTWTGAPDATVPADGFSARWTGFIQPRYSGLHIFYATSTGGLRLSIAGRLIIDQWTTEHELREDPAAIDLEGLGQKYELKVEYYDGSAAAVAKLAWAHSCQPKEIVPKTQLYPPGPMCGTPAPSSGDGLKGEYFDAPDLTIPKLTRTDETVAFEWATGATPAPAIEADSWSVRWSGYVVSKFSGEITFVTTSDDGVRLFVDDKPLIDNWTNHASVVDRKGFEMKAGVSYKLRLEYYNNSGSGAIKLEWESGCGEIETIPKSQLFTTPRDAGADAL